MSQTSYLHIEHRSYNDNYKEHQLSVFRNQN